MKKNLLLVLILLSFRGFGAETGFYSGVFKNMAEVELVGFNPDSGAYELHWKDTTQRAYIYLISRNEKILDSFAAPLSAYIDLTYDATQTVTYKVIAIGSDTTYTVMQVTPIFLQVKNAINPLNTLTWNKISIKHTGKYYIYRGLTRNNLTVIDSVYEKETDTKMTYYPTDNSKAYIYQVSAEFEVTKLKTDTGPFSQSLSNVSEACLVSNELISANTFKLYPNPASSSISIPTSEAARVFVYNSTGQLVLSKDIAGKEDVSIEALAAGLYKVCVETAAGVAVYGVVKE